MRNITKLKTVTGEVFMSTPGNQCLFERTIYNVSDISATSTKGQYIVTMTEMFMNDNFVDNMHIRHYSEIKDGKPIIVRVFNPSFVVYDEDGSDE